VHGPAPDNALIVQSDCSVLLEVHAPRAGAARAALAPGTPFRVRDYQRQAAEAFYLAGSTRGGSGVIVLPCGAGKRKLFLTEQGYCRRPHRCQLAIARSTPRALRRASSGRCCSPAFMKSSRCNAPL